MNKGLVSVIIPTWNRSARVVAAVRSAAVQTYPHIEIVVIDDGSTDDTREAVAALSRDDGRVRYQYQDNAGVSAARNAGLAIAQGDYMAFLDSDDAWYPWKVELQLACLIHYPEAGMVWTDMEAVGPDGCVFNTRYLKTMYRNYRRFSPDSLFNLQWPLAEVAPQFTDWLGPHRMFAGNIFSKMFRGNLVHTSTVLLTRQRLEQVKGFNDALKPSGEDYDFHLRTCREGPVAFADVASIRYQVGLSDQLTHPSYRPHMARNFLKTVELAIQNDRDRVDLPESVLNETLSYAHRWLGEALLFAGDRKEARKELAESLRCGFSAYAVSLYALALMPPGGLDIIRPIYRRLRRASRGTANQDTNA